jgi:hypothetical protein
MTQSTDQSSREQEREAFEAWYRRTLPKQLAYDLVSEWLSLDEDGRYDGDIQTAWEGWQARATLPPTAITAEEAGREGEAWLPIESAPKDGTTVLLWEQYNDVPAVGHYSVRHGKWYANTSNYDADGDAIVIDKLVQELISHWSPLPPAPAQSEEKAE